MKDHLMIDIKEVYSEKNTRHFFNPYPHHGIRMIEASKIFADGIEERLGYATIQGKQYWGRQIPSFAVKVKKYLDLDECLDVAYSIGSQLGHGHRKSLVSVKSAQLLEKDFLTKFDHYYQASKYLTNELKLTFLTMKKHQSIFQLYKNWKP